MRPELTQPRAQRELRPQALEPLLQPRDARHEQQELLGRRERARIQLLI